MTDNPIFNPNESDGVAEDAQEVRSDPFTGGGELALPGAPQWEQYKIGEMDNSNEQHAQEPGVDAPFPVGSNMGATSADVGIQGDNMRGLGVSAIPFFNDGEHAADGGGVDSMGGIDVSGSRQAPIPLIAG